MAGSFKEGCNLKKNVFLSVLYSLAMDESIYEKKSTVAIARLGTATVAATLK